MISGICKSNWCHSWENGCCDKKPKSCLSSNCNSFKDLNDHMISLMKSKRKVKLLIEICKTTKVIQGTICTVTDNTIFIIDDKCVVPTAISIASIKHVIPL